MLRRIVNQQMNVVHLAVHLYELGFEVLTHAVEDDAKTVEGIGVKYLLPTLGDEDQVNMKLTDTVPTVSNIT